MLSLSFSPIIQDDKEVYSVLLRAQAYGDIESHGDKLMCTNWQLSFFFHSLYERSFFFCLQMQDAAKSNKLSFIPFTVCLALWSTALLL